MSAPVSNIEDLVAMVDRYLQVLEVLPAVPTELLKVKAAGTTGIVPLSELLLSPSCCSALAPFKDVAAFEIEGDKTAAQLDILEVHLMETIPCAMGAMAQLGMVRIRVLESASLSPESSTFHVAFGDFLGNELKAMKSEIVLSYCAKRAAKLTALFEQASAETFMDLLEEQGYEKPRSDHLYNTSKTQVARNVYSGWKEHALFRPLADMFMHIGPLPTEHTELEKQAADAIAALGGQERDQFATVRQLVGVMTVAQSMWKPLPVNASRTELLKTCRAKLREKELTIPAKMSLLMTRAIGEQSDDAGEPTEDAEGASAAAVT